MFTTKNGSRIEIVDIALKPVITEEINEKLIEIPTPAEIKEQMFSIHPDKAPGPDGFSASFFHTNWAKIGCRNTEFFCLRFSGGEN